MSWDGVEGSMNSVSRISILEKFPGLPLACKVCWETGFCLMHLGLRPMSRDRHSRSLSGKVYGPEEGTGHKQLWKSPQVRGEGRRVSLVIPSPNCTLKLWRL